MPRGFGLVTEEFNTEGGFDFLTVNGEQFSGSTGLGTIVFAAGTSVSLS